MNNVYSDIIFTEGPQVAGICSFIMAAREWSATPVNIDFLSNKVITPVTLDEGYSWINVNCVYETMELKEDEKAGRLGRVYTSDLSGIINTDNALMLQQLETYRWHEWIVIYTDRKKQKRIIGNTDNGMKIFSILKQKPAAGGSSVYEVSLSFESAIRAPFYVI
ncbi:MAG TPA: hypothetical protein PL045_04375 [Chitinophagaceae bacterium]|nr:hypothetical protein [Chitinophagaceae bacterium]